VKTKEELALHIGRQIIKYRKDNKWTQTQLGEKLGTTKSTVANYESGYRSPKHPTLVALANVFKVSIDNFYPTVETSISTQALTKNEQALLNNYNQLNETGKQKASDCVEDLTGNRKYLKNNAKERVELSQELA